MRQELLLPALDVSRHEAAVSTPAGPAGPGTTQLDPQHGWLQETLAPWELQVGEAFQVRRFAGRRVVRLHLHDGTRLVLRTYPPPPPGRLTRSYGGEALASICSWLDALGEAGVSVPLPRRALDGRSVLALSVLPGETRAGRSAMLLDWLPGRAASGVDLGVDDVTAIGRHTAQLHDHASRWRAPEQFVRPLWGPEYTFRADAKLWRLGPLVLEPDVLALLAALGPELKGRLADLGRQGRATGVRHGGVVHHDLQPENVVLHEGGASAIDFDAVGSGAFLDDLACTALRLCGRPAAGDLHDALLDGYQQVRALPAEARPLLRLLVAARLAERLEALLRRVDPQAPTPWLFEVDAARAEETVLALRAVLASRPSGRQLRSRLLRTTRRRPRARSVLDTR